MRPSERQRRIIEIEAEAQEAALRGDGARVGQLMTELEEVVGEIDPADGVVDPDADRMMMEAKATTGRVLVRVVCSSCNREAGRATDTRHGALFTGSRPMPDMDVVAEIRQQPGRVPYPTTSVAVLLEQPRNPHLPAPAPGEPLAVCETHGPLDVVYGDMLTGISRARERGRRWTVTAAPRAVH